MIALKGILSTLRREPRCTAKEANVAASQLVELLRKPDSRAALPIDNAKERHPESERMAINTCLCLSALSRHRSIERRHWAALADVTLPLLPALPARQLTLALNALSRASAVSSSSPWLQTAAKAMTRSEGRGPLSGQDLLLALSAFARALYSDEDLVLHLVRDDAIPMVQELNAKSIAGVAQSSVRLTEACLATTCRGGDLAAHTATLLSSVATNIVAQKGVFFGPPTKKSAFDRFGSTEVALLLDALSRGMANSHLNGGSDSSSSSNRGLQEALGLAAASLIEHGSALQPQEVTMVFMAFSRLGCIPETGDSESVAAALLQAFHRVWKQLPGDELSMVLNAAAQLILPLEAVWSLEDPTHQDHLMQKAGEMDFEHHVISVAALSKLNFEVPSSLWRQLVSRCCEQEVASCKDGARLLLGAARSDYLDWRLLDLCNSWLRLWKTNEELHSPGPLRLSAISSEELGANLYARLHWFYQDLRSVDILLRQTAAKRMSETTQPLELQALMLLTSLALESKLQKLPLPSCRLLLQLEEDISALELWRQDARKRNSDLQLQVEHSLRFLGRSGSTKSEVPAGPFVIDLTFSP